MASPSSRPEPLARGVSVPPSSPGDAVPYLGRDSAPRTVVSPAARRAIRQRMLFVRRAALDRIAGLTGTTAAQLQGFHRDLRESPLPDVLVQRGAGAAFAHELPQGVLLYLLARAARPAKIVETGVRPGYSTAWLLAAIEANGRGELVSLGPGPIAGRSANVGGASVGQFVPPQLRGRWTLALGNTEERLREVLAGASPLDLFLYDNGPIVARARFELRAAWDALSPSGILLAHRIDANDAWAEFCRHQGLPLQVLDPGPPPMGALSVRRSG